MLKPVAVPTFQVSFSQGWETIKQNVGVFSQAIAKAGRKRRDGIFALFFLFSRPEPGQGKGEFSNSLNDREQLKTCSYTPKAELCPSYRECLIPRSLGKFWILLVSSSMCWADCLMIRMAPVCVVSLHLTDLHVFSHWVFQEDFCKWGTYSTKNEVQESMELEKEEGMRPQLRFPKFILFSSLVGIISSVVILETRQTDEF